GGASLTYFAPETLEPLKYTLRQKRDAWVSNYGEQLKVDAEGWITDLTIVQQNIRVRLACLRLPRWRKNPNERQLVRGGVHQKNPTAQKERSRSLDIFLRAANQRIGATLTLPPREQKLNSVVVFLAGSGMHDRNGQGGLIDLGYRKLLEGLAQRGVASIRHD